MPNPMIPGPAESEPQRTGHHKAQGNNRGRDTGRRQQPQSKKSGIPSENDCLLALAQIAGLAAMGLLKVGQANAIRGAYRDILQHHRSKAKEVEKSMSNTDVMDLLRKNPEMLSLLEPLLTQEQIAMVMNSDGSGDGGKD